MRITEYRLKLVHRVGHPHGVAVYIPSLIEVTVEVLPKDVEIIKIVIYIRGVSTDVFAHLVVIRLLSGIQAERQVILLPLQATKSGHIIIGVGRTK